MKAYLSRRPVRYPVLLETVDYGESGSSARYGNSHGVLPYSVLLDAQGRVVRSKSGPLTAAELSALAGRAASLIPAHPSNPDPETPA